MRVENVDNVSFALNGRADEWCMSVETRLDSLVREKSEVKAYVGGCPSVITDAGAYDALFDMRRRWSNNGGFPLRMLEESSSEVTSSSALGLPPAMVMSPESLASPEYGALELWSYDDGITYNTAQSLLGACNMQQQQLQPQQPHPAPPTLPTMPLPMPPTTPKSENESMSSGREELSPASSINGCSADADARRQKKGPAPRQQEELCLVCGDRASGYHYNALTCEGCKGFFRRSVTKNAVYICKFGHACEMDMYMRRKCQECRLKKCLAVGMRPECVIQEPSKNKDRQRQKKDKGILLPVSTTTVEDHMPPIMQCDPPPPEAARIHEVVPRYLSEKLMEQNRQKNIPPLSANQKSLIARLVWYQEGYEQPSDEDLKRVTQTWQSDEEDEESDLPFRQITEMTILTVQLIVEFAKGLPGFSKISQSDQITLLKASSSEVMMLRVARRYDAASDSVLFANNKAYTRDNYRKAGMAYVIEDLLHFCRCMFAMGMDNVHFALLTAIVIFSDRPGLEQPSLVEEIQRYYLNTLRIYIINQNSASSRCAVIYGRILSVLTELRTLGTQNSNMCISLKLKNRKLPPFLEEIWDVAEVATTHPTVLPPTNPVVL
ncbi:ecdysone receptor isoform X1 [Bombyx mandarina]|uniref:Ecdysone receptor n=3 Tax=Bombyx TaxID=7090 RepID=A0A6J2KAB4_BOMMA|nr:ecdysone receptor isoform X1 [Bombyx mandarina]